MSDTQPLNDADSGSALLPAVRRPLRAAQHTPERRARLALFGLVSMRLLLNTVFLLNILPLERRDPVFRWYLQHGGDQEYMFELARSILDGPLVETVVGIGQSLIMLPWIYLLKPAQYIEITAPLVFINGFLLGGLSVVLVDRLGHAATGSRRVGLIAAAIWAALPLFAYFAFFWHPESVLLRSVTVPKVGWLNGLSDGPATVFVLLGMAGLANVMRREQVGFWAAAGIGAALGAALLFRFHMAPFAATVLFGLLLFNGWRALLAALGMLLIVYLPQAWYNMAVFNLPFTTGYLSYGDMRNRGGTLRRPLSDMLQSLPADISPANVFGTLAYFLSERTWLIAPLAIALAGGAFAFLSLKRRCGWRAVYVLLGVPLAYLLPMLTTSNFRDDVIRFSMPGLPALLVAGVFTAGVVLEWLARRAPGSGKRMRAE
ncbi:MAG: hypothetical protein GX484_14745 [Chloroflexi bacterium]|nr:hypothetical protein [Chloroflexota bacterium]